MSDTKNNKPVDNIDDAIGLVGTLTDLAGDVANIISPSTSSGEIDNPAEEYIRKLYENKGTLSDYEFTLIAGNIRSFYSSLSK